MRNNVKFICLFLTLLIVFMGLGCLSAEDINQSTADTGTLTDDTHVNVQDHVEDTHNIKTDTGTQKKLNRTSKINTQNIKTTKNDVETNKKMNIKNSEFTNNTAKENDGAIFSSSGSYLNITDKTFKNSTGDDGAYNTIYDSDDNQNIKLENVTIIDVNKTNPIITTANMTGRLGSNVTLNATVTDLNNKAITTGRVLVKLNNKSDGYASIKDGKIAYTLYLDPNKYGKGGYNVTFVYSGNNTTTRTSTRLNIIPFNSRINLPVSTYYIDDTTILKVKISNGENYSAQSGNVQFKLNGLTYKTNGTAYKVQVTNGTAVLRFYTSKKFTGRNNITILYSGNGKFNAIKTTLTNKYIVKNQKRTIIKTNHVKAKVGDNVNINAEFTGVNGKPLTKGQVAIKINGKTFGHANIIKGVVNYTQYISPDKFSAKNYTITIKFGGKGKYTPVTANTTLQITKHTPKITYTTTRNRTNTYITVKIRDGQVNANNGTVGIKINGKTYKINNKAYTIKPYNGIVKFTIPTNNLKPDNNITFTYSGDKQFTGLKQTFNIKIKYPVYMIGYSTENGYGAVNYGESMEVYLSIYNGTGVVYDINYNPINNINRGNIKYYLNNTYIGSSTVKNGESTFKYTPQETGAYILKAIYTDNKNIYETKSIIIPFIVEYQDNYSVYLGPEYMNINRGKITVSISGEDSEEEVSGFVEVSVNGKSTGRIYKNKDAYKVEIPTNLANKKGLYLITITLTDDYGKELFTKNRYLQVGDYEPPLAIDSIGNPHTSYYDFEVNVWEMIGDDSTNAVTEGYITVTFDKQTKTIPIIYLDSSGIPFNYPSKPGNYTITVEYWGSNNYKPVTMTQTFEFTSSTINKETNIASYQIYNGFSMYPWDLIDLIQENGYGDGYITYTLDGNSQTVTYKQNSLNHTTPFTYDYDLDEELTLIAEYSNDNYDFLTTEYNINTPTEEYGT